MNMADLFTNDPWAEFDALPLPLQEWKADYYLKIHKLYKDRYERNSGKLGGRPKEWPDELLSGINCDIEKIMQTPEYQNKKDPREKGITAYVIMVEQLFERPYVKQMLAENKLKSSVEDIWQDEIKSVAKAIKGRVDAYKKRAHTNT